jgi:formylmethanofuran dehydrogenase subunit E
MGDDESRMGDTRVEAIIDRKLRNGTMGLCERCGDPTIHTNLDEFNPEWVCKSCYKKRGGEEE